MLETLFTSGLLLGERSTLGRLPAPPVNSTLPMLLGLGLAAVVVMALVVAFVQYRQRRGAAALNSPSELWAELCRVHQLDKIQSGALRELAEARAMEPVASVFVRADLWQLEEDSAELKHLRPQLQRLQEQLFAAPAAPKVVKI